MQITFTSAMIAGLFLGSALATARAQMIQVNKDNRTIAVTATDEATAEADSATVHIGFQVYAPDSDTAYSRGSVISNAVIDALKKAGVPEKSIESENQSLQQNGQYEQNESELDRSKRKFTLVQSWIVRAPANDAAKVLHIAVEAGANNSGAIDWEVTDRKGLQAKAAAKALAKAQAIAEQMASALKVTTKGLIYASNQAEGGGVRPMPIFAPMSRAITVQVQPLAINPRRIEESATVYAVFAIE
ncbi:MAG TPA: SIMPL domain-containing protein [Acidisarcina sp.]